VVEGEDKLKADDFVKSPISALRFISLLLRRTGSTPHSTRFARLELELFTKSSYRITSYKIVEAESSKEKKREGPGPSRFF
jgi:hypothetical protein